MWLSKKHTLFSASIPWRTPGAQLIMVRNLPSKGGQGICALWAFLVVTGKGGNVDSPPMGCPCDSQIPRAMSHQMRFWETIFFFFLMSRNFLLHRVCFYFFLIFLFFLLVFLFLILIFIYIFSILTFCFSVSLSHSSASSCFSYLLVNTQ